MMVDEIQTGFGRTGTWFGFEHTRRGPRRGDARQGDRQRHAGRGVLGRARRGGGVPARRPRQHVQRHGARHGGGRARSIDEMRRIDAPALAREAGRAASAPRCEAIPVDVGPRPRAAARRRARRRASMRRPCTPLLGRGLGHQRRQRRRRCGSPRRSPSATTRSTRRSALSPTSLEREAPREGSRRTCSTSPTSRADELAHRARSREPACRCARASAGRTRRRADLREALEPHPPVDGDGGRRSSAATRSTPAARRSASTCASRSRTSPGSWRATTPCIAARVFEHAVVERMAAVADVPVVNMLQRPLASAAGARRCAHDAAGARRLGRQDRRLGGRLQQRRPVARRGAAMLGPHVALRLPARLRRRRGRAGAARRCSARRRVEQVPAPGRGGRGCRRGAHRHLGVDGPGGREGGTRAGVRGLHRRRRDDGARPTEGGLHPLPAGLPRAGGRRPT